MNFHMRSVLHLLIISSLLCSLANAESSGSVFFIDGLNRQYLRAPSTNDAVKSMLLPEVGAAVSVLLGFAPPATLSATSSSKLNEILMPNPFNRPRAIFALEVRSVEDFPIVVEPANPVFSNAFRSEIILGSDKADIQLPGEEVSIVSLDEGLADFTDKEISVLASWLGGSYVYDDSEAMNGELTIPLAGGASMNLHMSKKADMQFIASLLSLFHNSRRAIEMHEDLSQGFRRPAELLMGCFDGIKALQEQYGHEGVVNQGVEVLLTTLSKILNSLEAAYQGQIVGVIFFNGAPLPQSERMLDMMLTYQTSARWLEETKVSHNATKATLAEVALVRKTLAWITGIVLLISTLLGIYFLLNMPLTRDTLLYSNVKLD